MNSRLPIRATSAASAAQFKEKQEEFFTRLIERLTALMESSSKQMRDRDLREYFLRF